MSPSTLVSLALVLAPAATLAAPPAARPAPVAKGRLQLTFTERSPLSGWDVLSERLYFTDEPKGTREVFEYDLAAESFDVFVPASYRPNVPHGLFVWMGVPDFPQAWLDVMARHKLIFVSAKYVKDRCETYAKSLDAVHNMTRRYNIDPKRVYVSGFSGGGVAATYMVQGYPEVFSGGYFLVWGGGFYSLYQNENKGWEVAVDSYRQWKGPLDQIKKDMKLVILKGEREGAGWTAQQGRANYEALLLDGFTRVSYLEVPRLAHTLPNTTWFEKGIVALESKPKAPPTTGPTTRPNPLPAQNAYARRILVSALIYLDQKPLQRPKEIQEQIRKTNLRKAHRYLIKVLEEYPATPAAARARELLRQHYPPETAAEGLANPPAGAGAPG